MLASGVLPVLLFSTLGCKAPPEAPGDLADLAGYMFEHFADEDPEAAAVGLQNLEDWLSDHIDDEDGVQDGYSVTNFDKALLESVRPNEASEADEIRGSSVATLSGFGVADHGRALSVEEQEVVFPDSYESHERVFESEKDCFVPQDCDFLDTTNIVEAKYAGVLNVNTNSRAQYRWVNYGEDGEKQALLHRTWLQEPADLSGAAASLFDLQEQLFLGVSLPWEGGAVRLSTTWVGVKLLSDGINEGYALTVMVNSMQKDAKTLEEFLQD